MRMGLLDDAIREHLELKRRRGADPDEVAREQQEALNAAAERQLANTGAHDAADPTSAAPVEPTVAPEIDGHSASTAEDRDEDSSLAQTAHVAGADETAELDMSIVLGDSDDADDPSAPQAETQAGEQADTSARPVPARSTAEEDAPDDESLEWEVPGEVAEEGAEEPAEDVLEETPDFLRDTPEQDRLWFEQRPPRDFDFDK
jgi:hypothetical protein